MKFHVLTLFPQMIDSLCSESILGRATEAGLIQVDSVNIRDFTEDKHKKVDDYTYGGGAGMLMQAQPVYDAWRSVTDGKPVRTVYVSPQGRTFDSYMAKSLAEEEELVFLCGHYEGIDERVLEEIVTDVISIGDYVLTGGELAVGVMIDAISRFVPGVLGNDESATTESFNNDLLEYPQYSRPEVWHGKEVPAVLLSGDHTKIRQYRLEQSIERTKERRPDLYAKYERRMAVVELLEMDSKSRRRNIHVTSSMRDGSAVILVNNGDILVTYIAEGGVCNIIFKNTEGVQADKLVIPKRIIASINTVYSNERLNDDSLKELGIEVDADPEVMRQYVYTEKVAVSVPVSGCSAMDIINKVTGRRVNGGLYIEDDPGLSAEELQFLEAALINEELLKGNVPFFQFPVDSALNSIQESIGTYESDSLVYVYTK